MVVDDITRPKQTPGMYRLFFMVGPNILLLVHPDWPGVARAAARTPTKPGRPEVRSEVARDVCDVVAGRISVRATASPRDRRPLRRAVARSRSGGRSEMLD